MPSVPNLAWPPTATATATAIDRVVHHSVILEFDVPSYRTNAAQQRGQCRSGLINIKRDDALLHYLTGHYPPLRDPGV